MLTCAIRFRRHLQLSLLKRVYAQPLLSKEYASLNWSLGFRLVRKAVLRSLWGCRIFFRSAVADQSLLVIGSPTFVLLRVPPPRPGIKRHRVGTIVSSIPWSTLYIIGPRTFVLLGMQGSAGHDEMMAQHSICMSLRSTIGFLTFVNLQLSPPTSKVPRLGKMWSPYHEE